MPWTLVILCTATLLYTLASSVYAFNHNVPMAIMYGGYAFANIGPIMLELR